MWKKKMREAGKLKESEAYLKARMIRDNLDRLVFNHMDTTPEGAVNVPVTVRIKRKPPKTITKINPLHLVEQLSQHMTLENVLAFMKTIYQKQCPKASEQELMDFLRAIETGKPITVDQSVAATVETTTLVISTPKR